MAFSPAAVRKTGPPSTADRRRRRTIYFNAQEQDGGDLFMKSDEKRKNSNNWCDLGPQITGNLSIQFSQFARVLRGEEEETRA